MPNQNTWRFINTFAPWFSAAGTIAAVITSLYLSQRDRRINLKVRASLRIQFVSGGGSGHGDRFVSIDVVNRGRRPVIITAVGFRYRAVRRGELLPSNHLGSSIPTKLADGDEGTYLYPLEDFCSGLFRNLPPESFRPFPSLGLLSARAIVVTSVGKVFYAPFTKGLRVEIAQRVHAASEA